MAVSTDKLLNGPPIAPQAIGKNIPIVELVEHYFQAYNSARLSEACRLFSEKILEDDVTVGMSLTGALTPAGLGASCIIPLIKAGFVDWIVSTGANLYHDAHFAIGGTLHQGTPNVDDRVLRRAGVIRIYDVLFDYEVLLSTDAFFRKILEEQEFQRTMGTAEFHYICGKYLAAREKALGLGEVSLLAAAYRYKVPVYTSSPGDSSIGMNVAAMQLQGYSCILDVSRDVNETAAIVYGAKKTGGKSAVVIFGGGSPKNFLLQTEPQIQEVLGLKEKGHDFFLQVTDARPDTGGLSGATPSEAVSWGKVDPAKLPDSVVVYTDVTIAMPIMTSYALAKRSRRRRKKLYQRRTELYESLQNAYIKRKKR
ncbi:MAG: deoxyhypusine synthase [Chlorobi bacterium]|nr:deoxyhypusine synthase [Chlorobiota bacterium]